MKAEGPENLHAKSLGGCMPEIYRLICKYQNRGRRFLLTFGKRQEKGVVISSSLNQNNHLQDKEAEDNHRRLPRSPTIPVEMRCANSPLKPTTTTLVLRLMGMTEIDAAENERQRLLRALDKCDRDLNTIKNIIDEVVKGSSVGNHARFFGALQPTSPALSSAPDEYFTRSAFKSYCATGSGPHKQKKKLAEENITNICFLDRVGIETVQAKRNANASPLQFDMAMTRSVDEVFRDIAWGERREIGRIGLALQDHICRDLIEEVVGEMGCSRICPLPFEACKRRLHF